MIVCVTVFGTARAFLGPLLRDLHDAGFDITLVSSPHADLEAFAQSHGARSVAVEMSREIDVASDLRSLRTLADVIRDVQPEIVSAGTPKAGLLAMAASWLVGVPVRIYQQRGLRLETATGFKRAVLANAERIACGCTAVVCNSESLRRAMISLRLAPAAKLTVLGGGSAQGVEVARFSPSPARLAEASALRQQLEIPQDAPVIGFVGRLTRDKGAEELVAAFDLLRASIPNARLLIAGGFEEGDPVSVSTRERIGSDPHIHHVGAVKETATYYHAMDLLAFPSKREGFPNVPLEAAAAGVPAVGYRVTGTMDAVDDGRSGLLVETGDVVGLATALRTLLADEGLRSRLGDQARERVEREFERTVVLQRWVDYYIKSLEAVHLADS
jgi:glycosyltransferase involved in cell wall biosynthesis